MGDADAQLQAKIEELASLQSSYDEYVQSSQELEAELEKELFVKNRLLEDPEA